jgi:hypothetical protein
VPGAVAHVEHLAVGGGAQAVREPVALVAHGGGVDAGGQRVGRAAHVLVGVVGAHADARLGPGGHPPAVAAAHERALDPDVEGVAVALGVRVDLEPAAERRVGRLVVGLGQDPPPAHRVDDEGRVELAAVARDGAALPGGAPAHRRALEARVAALRPQELAQLAIVEGRPAPRQAVAHGPVRRGEGHRRQLAPDGAGDAHGLQPRGRGRAGRRRARADRVAVDDQHVGAGARQLAGDGEPGEGRAADEDVGAQRRRHRPSAARAASHGRRRARAPSTS